LVKEQRDPGSGLRYLRARYYDPGTGRFLSRDPVRGWRTEPQSQHGYSYAHNNPVRWRDPTGRSVLDGPSVGGCSAGDCRRYDTDGPPTIYISARVALRPIVQQIASWLVCGGDDCYHLALLILIESQAWIFEAGPERSNPFAPGKVVAAVDRLRGECSVSGSLASCEGDGRTWRHLGPVAADAIAILEQLIREIISAEIGYVYGSNGPNSNTVVAYALSRLGYSHLNNDVLRQFLLYYKAPGYRGELPGIER
jgi:RHS repeat-associated protein